MDLCPAPANPTLMDQAATIALLGDPATHQGLAVERIDTDGAIIFLAGDRAYKIRRAVHFPHLDLSTPDRRRRVALAEVAVNRRTAPGLYEGVLAVVPGPHGRLMLAPAGSGADATLADWAAVDWVVVMRRFAESSLFDRQAEAGLLTRDGMRAVADAVAALHESAHDEGANRASWPPPGGVEVVRAAVTGALGALRQHPDLFDPPALERLERGLMAAVARQEWLIERRRRSGYVRPCHGDLQLGNICLWGGQPTLFGAAILLDEAGAPRDGPPRDGDVVDGGPAVIDVFNDLAYLLMDLEHRRLRPFANLVLNRYLEQTGDFAGLALLPLFISLCAAIRAHMTASTAAARRPVGAGASFRREAAAYLDLALSALNPRAPRLIAIGGLPGTGKSTLARMLAPEIGPIPGAVILQSEALRRRLLDAPEEGTLAASGYSEAVTTRVYGEMAGRAGLVLEAGHAVVADAVYARPDQRADIEAVAHAAPVPFLGLWLVLNQQQAADEGRPKGERGGRGLGEMRWDILSVLGSAADVARRLLSQLARPEPWRPEV
ncbi:AAA family ATPase [Nitrospirillum sp. BR 11164]|uniref:bifunctional aminoglycoside phosphotransferase/ATP-binding protein n=1 Tax=Nitrospirillum sp. BR 11164 TaxID=3104324 RepID=UPI002AFDECE6|nr:AAA family ATPase [Nitrospirillum sp. BR 11164]MEA1651511.1 AAA family ATPase [Nitrospirillum sp. BR 11164]